MPPKPKPREVWIWVWDNGVFDADLHFSKIDYGLDYQPDKGRAVKFREVMEDE